MPTSGFAMPRLNPIQEPTHPNPLPHKEDTPIPFSGCTSGCTGDPETDQGANLAMLAAVLLSLSPGDRAELASMLLEQRYDINDTKDQSPHRQPGQGEGKQARP